MLKGVWYGHSTEATYDAVELSRMSAPNLHVAFHRGPPGRIFSDFNKPLSG